MTGSDQRSVHRVPFIASALLRVAGRNLPVRLLDISLMGALVTTDAPLRLVLGDACEMSLTLGPEVALDLTGKVARTDEAKVAVRWGPMDVDNASHLRRLLQLNLGDHDLIEQDIEAMYAAHVNTSG